MHERGLSTTRLSARGEDTIEFGRRAAHALLESEHPTAFVCVSDTVAMGVLQALADLGRTPGPDDVAVVGFDDSLAAQVIPPGLTSVRQPLEEVAVQIVLNDNWTSGQTRSMRRQFGTSMQPRFDDGCNPRDPKKFANPWAYPSFVRICKGACRLNRASCTST